MWMKAFLFSLKVLRKSIFKLLIPALVLSLVMLLLNAFMAHVYKASFNILYTSPHIYFAPFIFILISVIVLWTIYIFIFKWAYPWVRAKVLFEGFHYLQPNRFSSHRDILDTWEDLQKISLMRYSSQRLSSFLACFLPVIAIPLLLYVNVEWVVWIVLGILYTNFIIPSIRGYLRYFYSECKVIDRSKQIQPTQQHATLSAVCANWKSIMLWKAILSIAYLCLLLLLGYWMVNVRGLGSSFYTEELFAIYGFRHNYFGYSHFLYGYAIAPFFSVFFQLPYVFEMPRYFQLIGFWPILIQIGFLLLLGLLTAFFFFVETLSTVYFFHQSLQNNTDGPSLRCLQDDHDPFDGPEIVGGEK